MQGTKKKEEGSSTPSLPTKVELISSLFSCFFFVCIVLIRFIRPVLYWICFVVVVVGMAAGGG